MEPQNSNDARPAEQIPPQPVYTKPAVCPDEYITIKISKTKLKKCIKLALIIVFVLSLWMNLMALFAVARIHHGMGGLMGGVRIQYHMNGDGGSYRMPGGGDFNGGNTYPGNGKAQYGNPWGKYRMPSN